MLKLKKYIENIPKPLIATIVYMMVVFFQSGVNLITTPIFSRILSTSEFGITTTYNSWYNLLTIFITLNLSLGVYNNALLDYEDDRDRMTSSFLAISIVISCIAFLIYCIFKDKICYLLGLSEYLIDFMFVNFLTAPAWGFFLARQKFDYKYIKPLFITIITFILNPFFGILAIYIFPNSKAVAKVIGCGLPTILVNIYFLIKIMKDGRCFYNKKYWKYALSFNIPLIPHYLSGVILSSSDRIMIQKMVGYSAAGIYGVSYQLSMVIQGVFSGINAALIPFTYKSLKKHKINEIKHYINIILIVVSFVSILLSIFAPEIIKILAPQEYYSAVWVVPPIVLGLYFSFIASLFGNIEFYYKKNKFVTIATSCAALLNIILNAIFIPKFGFIVAGYTTLLGYIVLTIIHYLFVKKIQEEETYNSKNILSISIITSIFIFGIMALYKFLIIRYLIILIIIIILIINYKKIYGLYSKVKNNS